MIKEIQLGGISATPDDYQSPDGQLDLALNLVPEDGHLSPLIPPSVLASIPDGYIPVFIHKMPTFTHYIFYHASSSSLVYADANQLSSLSASSFQLVTSISSAPSNIRQIGIILITTDTDGLIQYTQWNGDKYSGIFSIPDINLSFALEEEKEEEEQNFDLQLNGSYNVISGNGPYYFKFNTNDVNNSVSVDTSTISNKKKSILDKINSEGKFYSPFFVRCAFRLFDQSYVNLSSPVLLIPRTAGMKFYIKELNGTATAFAANIYTLSLNKASCITDAYKYSLVFNITNLQELPDVSNQLGNLVESLDIFVSAPITTDTDDQPPQGIRLCKCDNNNPSNPYSTEIPILNNKTYPSNIPDFSVSKISQYAPISYHKFSDPENTKLPGDNIYLLPPGAWEIYWDAPNVEDINRQIQECSTFYKVCSIPFNDLLNTEGTFRPSINDMTNLTNLNSLEDISSVNSNERLYAQTLFVHNNRLICGNVMKKIKHLQPLSSFSTYSNISDYSIYNARICFLVDDIQQGNYLTPWSDWRPFSPNLFYYLFYPNPNANKAYIQLQNTHQPDQTFLLYSINLTKHEYLTGVYWFKGIEEINNTVLMDRSSDELSNSNASDITSLPNTIFVSEVENPFLFPHQYQVSVGTGDILSLATNTHALSEGQFGQHPLYVFTTDGIWALSPNSEGVYIAQQPLSRDVCINPNSITSIDNAVVFVTARGLMLVSGSQVWCISDDITRSLHVGSINLPLLDRLNINIPQLIPFTDFIMSASIIFDYINRHLIVYRPDCPYSWIYSMKSKSWGMMHSSLVSSLNAYPEAIAIDNQHQLVSFNRTNSYSTSFPSQLLITRPLKLGSPDTFKTIHTLIQRGIFQQGDVQTLLYGSRDLLHWHLIASSSTHIIRHLRGTPYKYFRVVAIASLSPDKSLISLSIDYQPRHLAHLI